MIRNKKRANSLIVLVIFINLFACRPLPEDNSGSKTENKFDPVRAYQDIAYQVSLGPRTIGSTAHSKVVEWIDSELQENGWDTQLQVSDWDGNEITNVIGKHEESSPWIVIGAHYDSRFSADRDPSLEKRGKPVPGANDGASGVAVLLELARVIPVNLDKEIWLVFFDAEDNGNLPGWEWSIGANKFVEQLERKPDAVVILDMIGDEDLQIYKEKNSNPTLTDEIWMQAGNLGYTQFIQEYNHRMIDDHIPFLQQDIAAALIIDFDYPYWHTSEDNLDKVSSDSLEAVGNTVLEWLRQFKD
jgi:Zn-dependent M28 family amino/carboxypeptidase